MAKNTFFTGQPIISQLLSLIPHSLVSRLAREHHADRYCKTFKAYDHIVTMLFGAFHRCSSLRELITGMQASAQRLSHLGLLHTPRRSTLADANKRRSAPFFEALFHELYRRHYGALPDSLKCKTLLDRLFIVDSTTVSLFSDVMKGMGSYGADGREKGGAKAHLLVRAKDNVPCFVRLTSATTNDKSFLHYVSVPQYSIIVMDRGYNSYKKMITWNDNKVSWVTRLHPRSVWKVIQQLPVSEKHQKLGVRKDYLIELGNPRTLKINPLQQVRLVVFYDQQHDREFQFISNNRKFSPFTIAQLYQKRWQIEILFKRLKQNFPLQDFLGDNENAIKIQIWCTLIADLLVKIVKDRVDKGRKKKWAFANLVGLIRQHLTTYLNLYAFLLNPDKAILKYRDPEPYLQLKLFKT